MVNIRQKGARGEREVCDMMNDIVIGVRSTLKLPELEKRDLPFQRNQLQTAVGGDDITNPFKLSIEVKRQEQLSINTWWKQCKASAERFQGNTPILIFKQSCKKWRVMMETWVPLIGSRAYGPVRVELSIDDFKGWFTNYCLEFYKVELDLTKPDGHDN